MNSMDWMRLFVATFFDSNYCIDKQWEGANVESTCRKTVDIRSVAIPEKHFEGHCHLHRFPL